MNTLSELTFACRGIESDRVTERKKNASELQQILKRVAVVKQLDSNSETLDNRSCLRWSDVFQSVCRYVSKDIKHQRELSEKRSSEGRRPSNTSKADSFSLFKQVIDLANRKTPLLKCDIIVHQIKSILTDEYYLKNFGFEYAPVLLDKVLKVRKMWTKLTLRSCQEFLQLFSQLYEDPPNSPDWNQIVTVQIIEKLILILCTQSATNMRSLFTFFNHVLNEKLKEQSSSILEPLLSSCVIFIRHMALTYRILTCKLGENVIIPLLHVWQTCPRDRTKLHIVKFLQFQMSAHHPRGTKEEIEGAYACDWSKWKALLRNMHEVLQNEVMQVTTGRGFQSRNETLHLEAVSLAADVCHQVFSDSLVSIGPTPTLNTSQRRSAKRRRIETGIKPMCEFIKETSTTIDIIPRLQLLEALIRRYPKCLSADEYFLVLQVVYCVLTDCKLLKAMSWLLKLAKSISASTSHVLHDRPIDQNIHETWKLILNLTTRSISLNTCKDEGYSLIQEIIHQGFFHHQEDLYALFMPHSPNVPSKEAILTLSFLVKQNHILQTSFKMQGSRKQHSMRVMLIEWMLPKQNDQSRFSMNVTQSTQSVVSRCGDSIVNSFPSGVAALFTCLCLKDSSVLVVKQTKQVLSSFDEEMYSVQEAYLQATFDTYDIFEDVRTSAKTKPTEHIVIDVVKETLIDLVIRDCSATLDICLQNEARRLNLLSGQCCFLAHLIQNFLKYDVMNESEILVSPLTKMQKNMMSKLSLALQESVKMSAAASSDTHVLISVVSTLVDAIKFRKEFNKSQECFMSKFWQVVMPDDLLASFFDIFKIKKSGKSSKIQSSNANYCSKMRDGDNDSDFDVFRSPMSKASADSVDDDCSDFENSDTEDDVTHQVSFNNEFFDLQSNQSSSKFEKLRLETARLLSCWCCRISEAEDGLIFDKIVNEVLNTQLDKNNYVKLKLTLVFLENLTVKEQCFQQRQIHDLLEILRGILKEHNKDQRLVVTCIKLLTQIVAHLPPDLSNEDESGLSMLTTNRKHAIFLLNIYLPKVGDLDQSHMLSEALLKCLLQLLKVNHEDWALTTGNCNDSQISMSVFRKFLSSKNLSVRLMAAKYAWRMLFQPSSAHRTGFVAHDAKVQCKVNELLISSLKELLSCKEKSNSLEESADINSGKLSSMLLCYGSVLIVSPFCEPAILLSLCELIDEHDFNPTIVLKVLNIVSQELTYPSVRAHLEENLDYLLHHWFSKSTVSKFPYCLLDCQTKLDFCLNYSTVIVPELMFSEDIKTIRTIADEMQKDVKKLIEPCIPNATARIVPYLAMKNNVIGQNQFENFDYVERAEGCEKILETVFNVKVIEETFREKLDVVLVHLLNLIHETSAAYEVDTLSSEPYFPSQKPYSFSPIVIEKSLEYLKKVHCQQNSLIQYLCKVPGRIPSMMLSLSSKIYNGHQKSEKHRLLLAYALFVKILLPELGKHFMDELRRFVIRDIIFTVVHLLKSDRNKDPHFTSYCLDLLIKICSTAIQICISEISQNFSVIVDMLIPIATAQNNQNSKSAHMLLKFLIVDCQSKLEQAISLLDPLPNNDIFHELQLAMHSIKYSAPLSLNEEIKNFLDGQKSNCSSRRIEGLQNLLKLLSQRKDELKIILDAFQCEKIFSEHISKSNFHQLICELIKLSSQAVDKQVSIEAARCLGEIGPIDLSCIVLISADSSKDSCNELTSTDRQMWHILFALNKLLIDENITVKTACFDVLYQVMRLSSVKQFLSAHKGSNIEDFLQYICPFIGKKQTTVRHKTADESFREDCDVWIPNHDDHGKWVMDVVCHLLSANLSGDSLLQLLGPICKVKVEFCEQILPFLVHKILKKDNEISKMAISKFILGFFQMHSSTFHSHDEPSVSSASTKNITCNQKSVKTMINVVQYLRTQDIKERGNVRKTPWDNNFWLDIDYLDVALAAKYCSTHFTAIVFAEIWINQNDEKRSHLGLKLTDESQSYSKLDEIPAGKARILQDLLSDAYSAIGDNDSVYGCKYAPTIELSDRMKIYNQENQWDNMLSAFDLVLFEQPSVSKQHGLLKTLQNFGFRHLQETYLKSIDSTNSTQFQQFQYECAWRNARWGTLDVSEQNSTEYHQQLYKCFCNLQDNDEYGLHKTLESARLSVAAALKIDGIDACRNIYTELSKLQCLSIIDDVVKYFKDRNAASLLSKWHASDSLFTDNFEYVEPILTVQQTALKLIQAKDSNYMSIRPILQDRLQKMSDIARIAGSYQVAEKCLHELKDMHARAGLSLWQLRLDEARLLWARNEKSIAKQNLKSLLYNLKQTDQETDLMKFHPLALTVYGKWLAETCSESPSVIMKEYLEEAIVALEQQQDADVSVLVDTYRSLARYADLQYRDIIDYFKSPTYQSKRECINRFKLEASRLQSMPNKTKIEVEAIRMHTKNIAIDEAELYAMHKDENFFLVKSIENYVHCLRLGSDYILPVFRLISLWFQNSSRSSLNDLIKKNRARIPSYKFLPLMNQLSARMSDGSSQQDFQSALQDVIIHTSIDHPHHTLPIILAAANAPKDLIYDSDLKTVSQRTKNKLNNSDGRVLAAESILNQVSRAKHKRLVAGMKKMCDAYISLAYLKPTSRASNVIPTDEPIRTLKNIPGIPVPTVDIAVEKDGKYNEVPCIKEVKPIYEFVGGVSHPKKIKCIGTDGKTYIQLAKGKDDLRQDAVMQQFFSLVNDLLKQDHETCKRKLNMRTYKVIPLSQRSGIVQWCEGTQPFAEYLSGSNSVKGAHEVYRPKDLTKSECFAKMKKFASKSNQEKLENYLDICKQFKPVFRHFFFENFPEPAVWYERKLTYTQSVATCSVVGYILGLGDRHVHNILIDKKTAEFIHIDLGIAFEQGKILPTPETVPFRLTRDVIDGMGSMGVEGVFRRCCEKTMNVMHSSQEVLLTIPEVLLYDPLHQWVISQEKIAKVRANNTQLETTQSGTSRNGRSNQILTFQNFNNEMQEDMPEVNKIAERVLLRLKEKLQGVENGIALSISGQINHLIQEAVNVNNLSRLFHGWQPYL